MRLSLSFQAAPCSRRSQATPAPLGEMPPGVGAIIASTLKREPGSLNTDWFGTTLVDGLLRWSRRGFPEVGPFALAWLEHHLKSPDVSRYAGRRSRQVLAGGVAITTYAGHFGLAMPCYELATRFGDALRDGSASKWPTSSCTKPLAITSGWSPTMTPRNLPSQTPVTLSSRP